MTNGIKGIQVKRLPKKDLEGRKVWVYDYEGTHARVFYGMLGSIEEINYAAGTEWPIKVSFGSFTELFNPHELRYLNNKPVKLY